MAPCYWFNLLFSILFHLQTCIAIKEVQYIRVTTAIFKGAASPNTINITLWFNYTIYRESFHPTEDGTTYTSTTFDILGTSDCHKSSHNKSPEAKVMIGNENTNAIIFDEISFGTLSGAWYGIKGRCIDSELLETQDWLYYNEYSDWIVDEVLCSSGTSNVWMSVDKDSTDSAPAKQIFYFDTTRANQYINDAQWSNAMNVTPQIVTCDPTNINPTQNPSIYPTKAPTFNAILSPTQSPSNVPTISPSNIPTISPSINVPTQSISPTLAAHSPTLHPTMSTLQPTYKISPTFMISQPSASDIHVNAFLDTLLSTTWLLYLVIAVFSAVSCVVCILLVIMCLITINRIKDRDRDMIVEVQQDGIQIDANSHMMTHIVPDIDTIPTVEEVSFTNAGAQGEGVIMVRCPSMEECQRKKNKSNMLEMYAKIDEDACEDLQYGKCAQMDCGCDEYINNQSKWSKNQCKTCNHKENQHEMYTGGSVE